MHYSFSLFAPLDHLCNVHPPVHRERHQHRKMEQTAVGLNEAESGNI
jgi:hypothetical protein